MKMKQRNKDMLYALHHADSVDYQTAEGIRYHASDGHTTTDLCELRVVLGQDNERFRSDMQDAFKKNTSLRGRNRYKEELFQWLDNTTDGIFRGFHLTASGSEAVENAIKLARKITGKTEVISFWNSIHGRTHLSASLSGVSKRKSGYGPLAPGIVHFPYPESENASFDEDERLFQQILENGSAQDVAAIIVELWQGNGVVFPPKGYMKRLESWAKARGMLFIVDEIQTGMGRCGAYYRYRQEQLEPDILLLGKALGNGMHISAMLTKEYPAGELHVFAGGAGDDPVSCAAACAVFRQLDSGLLAHIASVGKALLSGLCGLRAFDCIERVQGEGLAASVVFREQHVCEEAVEHLEKRGYLVGISGRRMFLKPPYVITAAQIQEFLGVFAEILECV